MRTHETGDDAAKPKVVGVGDSLRQATLYYEDGSIVRNGVEVEQTRASKELARYRAGGMTFDQLVELWSTRSYDPCPHASTPDEVWQMDQDGEFGGGPGTWDEIAGFWATGKLITDECHVISGATDACHPRAQP